MAEWAQDLRPVDLAYLDASDLKWNHPVPSAHHHLNELMAIMPALEPRSMVAVDDSPATMDEFLSLKIGGKGEFVARYAFSVGADLALSGYQVGWTNVTAEPNREVSIEEIIQKARRHVEEDNLVAAEPLYRLILHTTTKQMWTPVERVARGEACVFFARLALARKSYGVSRDWYILALAADPAAISYRIELATKCLFLMRQLDEGVSELRRATEIDPENYDAWKGLGGLEFELQHCQSAKEAYSKAIALEKPGDYDATLGQAALAIDTRDYDLVREMCARVRGTDREADAIHLEAMMAFREGRCEESIVLFDKAISANCFDKAIAHWHKSISLESIGRYQEAWKERAHRKDCLTRPLLAVPMRRFNKTLWNGEAGGRVHVHTEAGAGDNLCLVRYLPLVKQRAAEVCYECTPDMLGLMRRSFPDVEVVPRSLYYPDSFGIKPFDWHCPVGHLQYIFRTSLETVPWEGPYFKTDPALVEMYRAKMPPGRKVGLCWSSGIRINDSTWLAEYGRRKSMHFDALSPVIRCGCSDEELLNLPWFVSLQVGPERGQSGGYIDDVLPETPTWDDTAALVECLDLVITVDTAVAHLAGALGKSVWLMMHTEGSWHWMVPRPGAPWNERSPWYPSVKIYRAAKAHEWGDVIERIAADLGVL